MEDKKERPKYKIGQKLFTTKDIELKSFFSDESDTIKKGSPLNVRSDGFFRYQGEGFISKINYDYELEGYATKDIAEFVVDNLEFDIVDYLYDSMDADLLIDLAYDEDEPDSDDPDKLKEKIRDYLIREIGYALDELLK